MEGAAISYFSSVSSLAGKIFAECQEIKNSFGDEWHNLPVDKQDYLLDQHFIDYVLLHKYTPGLTNAEIIPCGFPVLEVTSGEKIVVDFEHCENGWTWRDEHSGPFSWRTKSQQDLTLEDLGSKEEVVTKKTNISKMSFQEKSELGIAQASKNEVEEMFQKFGLRKHGNDNRKSKRDTYPENLGFEHDNETNIEPSVILNSYTNCNQMGSEKFMALSDETDHMKPKAILKSSRKRTSTCRKKPSETQEKLGNSSMIKEKDSKELGSCNVVFQEFGELSLEEFLSRPLESLHAPDQVCPSETNPPLKKTGLDLLDNW